MKQRTEERREESERRVLPSAAHFLPHCRTPLCPWADLYRDPLLSLELLLPELDTLSDLLMDLLVGSSSRSSIWRMVLCLRLNGLVYMLACVVLNRLSNTILLPIFLDFTQGEGNFLRRNSVDTFCHFLRLYRSAFTAELVCDPVCKR